MDGFVMQVSSVCILFPLILTTAAECCVPQRGTAAAGSLRAPSAPAVTFYNRSEKPYVQISWDYSVAPFFNIYRARSARGRWRKVNDKPYPQAAHAAVDYSFPRDARLLYYRVTSVDAAGNESHASGVSSIRLRGPLVC